MSWVIDDSFSNLTNGITSDSNTSAGISIAMSEAGNRFLVGSPPHNYGIPANSRTNPIIVPNTVNAINNVYIKKKWFGNRDSSTVISQKQTKAIISEKNINSQLVGMKMPTTNVGINTVRQALGRTRAGGTVVPAKSRYAPGSSGVINYGGTPITNNKPSENNNNTNAVLMSRRMA
jgi:hypothetical protein